MPLRVQVGAVVVFDLDVNLEEAKAALAKLGVRVDYTIVKEYNPEHGEPTWYVP